MKTIINFSKRTNRFKVLMALFTCLLFLIPPACEKLEPNQDSIPGMDEMIATPRAASGSSIMYWGVRGFTDDWPAGSWYGDDYIEPPWFDVFGNFVLKVQNVNGAAKISKLEVSIDGVVIITAKGLSRDYFAVKALRSLAKHSHLEVKMEGDQYCSINVWVEGTLKLGKAYGGHFYYTTKQRRNWWETNDFCNKYSGHLVIINNAKENNFLLSLTNDRGFFIGLTDLNPRSQDWYWIDGTHCRLVMKKLNVMMLSVIAL